MPFVFKKCFSSDNILFDGLYEVESTIVEDSRGSFLEIYKTQDFFEHGLTMKFVQENQSFSYKGVLRGLHFQKQNPQGKLVRVIFGKVFDVAVDLRKGSKTFGKYYSLVLDSNTQNQFYIPEGFAHGFYVLSENAVFSYKCTNFYDPKSESGIIWNDPFLNINWPFDLKKEAPLLKEKDKNYPGFDFESLYYDLNAVWIGK